MKYLGVYILIVAFILGMTISTIKLCGKISKNINVMVLLTHYVSKAALTGIGVYYSLIYLSSPYLYLYTLGKYL